MHKLNRLLCPVVDNSVKMNVTFTANILSVRYRKALVPRKHVEPDFRRKQMLAVCEPIFAADKRLPSERCYNLQPKREREVHPWDRLLAEDMKQELRTSRMICFFHQNVMTNREKKLCANSYQHEHMYLRYYNPDIAQLAMSDTKWAPALHLCSERAVTVLFSDEPRVAKMLKVTKKCPQLILMAAIIDDRFLSVADIKDYNRLPDLQTLRAQLSHTLSMTTRSVSDKAFTPIISLTNSIDSYIRDKNK